MVCSPIIARAQMLVPPWGDRLSAELQRYQSCDSGANEKSPTACNIFLSRALKAVYSVDEFRDPADSTHYLEANLIFVAVRDTSKWQEIGTADQDAALVHSQGLANSNIPVIAVQFDAPNGHVAMILPGTFTKTSWGDHTPNSASFFLKKPLSSAYIGLPLSKAWKWQERKAVHLYRHL